MVRGPSAEVGGGGARGDACKSSDRAEIADEDDYAVDDGLVEHIMRCNPLLTREDAIAELEEWGF